MRKAVFGILAILLFQLPGLACPCIDCPNEDRPDTVRILHQKVWLKSNLDHTSLKAAVVPHKYFNSIVIRFGAGQLLTLNPSITLRHIRWMPNDEWFPTMVSEDVPLHADEHATQALADQSQLVICGDDCRRFYIEAPGVFGVDSVQVEVILIYVPRLENKVLVSPASRSSCTAPNLILQSEWRKGLPLPIPGRSITPTHHCIIHHSGENQGDTNFTQIVRSYYTYHTQVNGWDDIAYNYLIAANGDVYAGRDPEKVEISQDNVLGAHFCSKNNNTMGVCMIGNFMKDQPTTAAMSSLNQLLAWKIRKDSLDPYGSYLHPNNSGSPLPVIAGHRMGCATDCPGDLLFTRLEEIRSAVAPCAKVNTVISIGKKRQIQPVLQDGKITFPIGTGTMYLRLIDPSGRIVWAGNWIGQPIEFMGSGILIYQCLDESDRYTTGKLFVSP